MREGTEKFILHFYNAKSVRGRTTKSKHFVYKQWGTLTTLNENNKPLGKPKQFHDYGEMLTLINKAMRKRVMKNLKSHRTWD